MDDQDDFFRQLVLQMMRLGSPTDVLLMIKNGDVSLSDYMSNKHFRDNIKSFKSDKALQVYDELYVKTGFKPDVKVTAFENYLIKVTDNFFDLIRLGFEFKNCLRDCHMISTRKYMAIYKNGLPYILLNFCITRRFLVDNQFINEKDPPLKSLEIDILESHGYANSKLTFKDYLTIDHILSKVIESSEILNEKGMKPKLVPTTVYKKAIEYLVENNKPFEITVPEEET